MERIRQAPPAVGLEPILVPEMAQYRRAGQRTAGLVCENLGISHEVRREKAPEPTRAVLPVRAGQCSSDFINVFGVPSEQLGSAGPQQVRPPQEGHTGQVAPISGITRMEEDDDDFHLEIRRKPRGGDRPLVVTECEEEEEEEEEEEDVKDYDTPPASREGPALAASSEQNA